MTISYQNINHANEQIEKLKKSETENHGVDSTSIILQFSFLSLIRQLG